VAEQQLQTLNGLILTPVVNEFNINGPFLSLASGIGLVVGSVFWGLGCDIMGRRYVQTHLKLPALRVILFRFPFHATLFMIGVFGLASGGAPNFVALCSLISIVGFGVAGLSFLSPLRNTRYNGCAGLVPVDSAIFLGEK